MDTVSLDTSGYLTKYGHPTRSTSYAVNKLPAGKYVAKIVDKYGDVIVEDYINILKIPTKISASTIKTVANSKYTLKVYLKDTISGKNINQGTLNIKINGKTYNVKIKNGVATLNFKVPSKLKTYSCSVSFKGNTNYTASYTKFNMVVKKYNSKITTKSKITLDPNEKYTLKVNVNYANGKKITSGTVKISINGKTYTAKISKGVAKVNIKAPSKAGQYNVSIVYGGNKLIHGSSATSKLITSFTVYVPIYVYKNTSKTANGYDVCVFLHFSDDGNRAEFKVGLYKNSTLVELSKYKAHVWLKTNDGDWINWFENNYGDKNHITDLSFSDMFTLDIAKVKIWI